MHASVRAVPTFRTVRVVLLAVVFGRAFGGGGMPRGEFARVEDGYMSTTRNETNGGEVYDEPDQQSEKKTHPRLKFWPPLLGFCLASPNRQTSYV